MKPSPFKAGSPVSSMQNNRLNLSVELKARLLAAIERFPTLRILAVGDVMLDRFIWGEVNRISPEAPVPVVDVVEETNLLGGCANVAHNVWALGGQVFTSGIVGEDAAAQALHHLFSDLRMDGEGLVVEPHRRTTVKTRIIAQNQQVVRFDREDRTPIQPASLDRILAFIQKKLGGLHGIVVSDYAKGVITLPFMNALRHCAREFGVPILVDPKVEHVDLYRGVTMITPNHHEAAQMSQVRIQDEDSLVAAGRVLLERLGCESVLITRGKAGMSLFHGNSHIEHIPTVARRVFDVTGAGDTVIAVLSLAIAAGLNRRESAILANAAAGIVVGEVGTSVVSAEQLLKAVQGV